MVTMFAFRGGGVDLRSEFPAVEGSEVLGRTGTGSAVPRGEEAPAGWASAPEPVGWRAVFTPTIGSLRSRAFENIVQPKTTAMEAPRRVAITGNARSGEAMPRRLISCWPRGL